MPVNERVRNMILNWISEGKTYTEIIDLVKQQGQEITRGGITYIKKSEEKTKQKTKQTKQEEKTDKAKTQEEATKDDKKQEPNKSVKSQIVSEKVFVKLLSDLEFTTFESSLKIVVNSNLIRLKTANAPGILNALQILEDTCDIIKQRGKYQ